MQIPGLFRTATFRLTLAVVFTVVAGVASNLTFFYLRFVSSEIIYLQNVLRREAFMIAQRPEPTIVQVLEGINGSKIHLTLDCVGLFDRDLNYIAGDLPSWPDGLRIEDDVQQLNYALPLRPHSNYLFLTARLPSHHVLVFAISQRRLDSLRNSLLHTMVYSLLPLIAFALCVGIYLSHRTLSRVGGLNEAIERIMEGDLSGRLPAGRSRDDLERLAGSVNRMLDRIEYLMVEIRNVGNDIAHDLRTPLSRMRVRLERALNGERNAAELHEVIEKATQDLDQCFSTITAILRIAELEDGRRKAGFATHDLRIIVADMVELYEPIAETHQLTLIDKSSRGDPLPINCDRDLLIEVMANLLDNAIKFTPAGGHIEAAAYREGNQIVLRIADTGIGIPESERKAVIGRFYRSDKSRHIPGSGLGLSLVMAILRLHGTSLEISSYREGTANPGAVFQMFFAMHQEEETDSLLSEPLPETL